MTNNQKRNWQRLMQDRADMIAEVCMMPASGITADVMRKRFREAYIYGYKDGRKYTK